MKPARYFFPILFLAVAALACRAAERALDTSPGAIQTTPPAAESSLPTVTPAAVVGATPQAATPLPMETEAGEAADPPLPSPTAAGSAAAPPPAGKPPQSQQAEVRPPELRPELTRASALMGFQVLDRDGSLLGTVSDMVINTCETYLIYFLLAPAEGLAAPAGNRLVIPYEAVTINSGALDAAVDSIQLSLSPGHFAAAPAFPETQELVPTEWEAKVREYWSQYLRISNLTTGCRVSAPGGGTTEIHKVAYATRLIGAELRDGLQNELGRVEEIILEPESGKVSFFVTRLQGGPGLALVPLRVVNIPKEALGPGTELSLVLLTENERLLNAPQIGSLEEAVNLDAQGSARGYWGR